MLAANIFSPLFDPLVHGLSLVLTAVHSVIPNYGVALIVLALLVRLVLWPLTNMQFKSMAEMQKVQPLVKQLQARYKNDQQQLNQKMMELYKEHNVNPLAGCVPMLIQFPILIGLYWAIQERIGDFKNEHFLWIGSSLAQHFHDFLATSLAEPDVALLALYVISMYFTVRYGSPPSTDPQQAQTQKIMAIVSPAMIAIFGFKYRWASALYIYWLAMNVFTVAQQLWMYRQHGLIGPNTPDPAAVPAPVEQASPKTPKAADGAAGGGKSRYSRRARKRAGR